MGAQTSEDQDWRLEAKLDVDDRGELDSVIYRIRPFHEDALEKEMHDAVGHDVVITHDGKLLFAYAYTEEALERAKAAIEGALRHDGIKASLSLSVWDHDLDDWRPVDRPPGAAPPRRQVREEHDAQTSETRTLVAAAGALIKKSFEQTMSTAAQELGLECQIAERHPHLLRTQIAFAVTGPKRKIDEFAERLDAEGWATIRAESNLLNPL